MCFVYGKHVKCRLWDVEKAYLHFAPFSGARLGLGAVVYGVCMALK